MTKNVHYIHFWHWELVHLRDPVGSQRNLLNYIYNNTYLKGRFITAELIDEGGLLLPVLLLATVDDEDVGVDDRDVVVDDETVLLPWGDEEEVMWLDGGTVDDDTAEWWRDDALFKEAKEEFVVVVLEENGATTAVFDLIAAGCGFAWDDVFLMSRSGLTFRILLLICLPLGLISCVLENNKQKP